MAACVFAIPELQLLLVAHVRTTFCCSGGIKRRPCDHNFANLRPADWPRRCIPRQPVSRQQSLTPALYKCVRFSTATEHALRTVDDAPSANNGRWAFTRALLAHNICDLYDHDPDIVPHRLNKGLTIILRHAKNLQSFWYV